MEGSGSNYNRITAINAETGESRTVPVLSSGEIVEFGGWTVLRDDLLLAIGYTPREHNPLNGK